MGGFPVAAAPWADGGGGALGGGEEAAAGRGSTAVMWGRRATLPVAVGVAPLAAGRGVGGGSVSKAAMAGGGWEEEEEVGMASNMRGDVGPWSRRSQQPDASLRECLLSLPGSRMHDWSRPRRRGRDETMQADTSQIHLTSPDSIHGRPIKGWD